MNHFKLSIKLYQNYLGVYVHKTQGNYLVLYWCKFCSTLAKQFLLWVFCLVGRCLAVL